MSFEFFLIGFQFSPFDGCPCVVVVVFNMRFSGVFPLPFVFSFSDLNYYVLLVPVYFGLYPVCGKSAHCRFLKMSQFSGIDYSWVLVSVSVLNSWCSNLQVVFIVKSGLFYFSL